MGNSNSQDGVSTTNSNGENVINFDLLGGGGGEDQVVITRDFSDDLVDHINYDDQYLEKKYPGYKEQQLHFDALIDSFTRCNLDVEKYYKNLKVPDEYGQLFIELCPMNDYTKFRTGKFNRCVDGIFPIPARQLTEKEAKEINRDILYCVESNSVQDDFSAFESRRMRWSEPETLIQVKPRIMSILKSRKFNPNNDEPTNIMSNYYANQSDDEKSMEEKLLHIKDQIATKEYDAMMECTSKAKDLEKECILEKQSFGLLVGTALCKTDILECLAKNSSLHGNKLEEVSSVDYVNCVSTSNCFSKIN